MKDYANLFEQAKQQRDITNMERLFDEVLKLVPEDETQAEVGARIAEQRNRTGHEGRKIV